MTRLLLPRCLATFSRFCAGGADIAGRATTGSGGTTAGHVIAAVMSQTDDLRLRTDMGINGAKRNQGSSPKAWAASRQAERRQCPSCGRKSALTRYYDGAGVATGCRWCEYATYRDLTEDP